MNILTNFIHYMANHGHNITQCNGIIWTSTGIMRLKNGCHNVRKSIFRTKSNRLFMCWIVLSTSDPFCNGHNRRWCLSNKFLPFRCFPDCHHWQSAVYLLNTIFAAYLAGFTTVHLSDTCQGLYSLSDKTSYCKISWSLEVSRFVFILFQSLWNLTGPSAAALSSCQSNSRAVRWL